jgi:DNA-binding PadR family transcriptional regulator
MFRSDHSNHRMHHREWRGSPDDLRQGFRRMFGQRAFGRGAIRRGDIRPLILAALSSKPMHGYEVIQALEAQSGGRWRPSAGSVYPTLQQLQDEGMVTSTEIDGRRTYTLTDAGRAAAEANPAPDPWSDDEPDDTRDLPRTGMQLMGAVMQVHRIGSAQARSEAARILADARRQMYRLLADDDTEPTAAEGSKGDQG